MMHTLLNKYSQLLRPPYNKKHLSVVGVTLLFVLGVPIAFIASEQNVNFHTNAQSLATVEPENGTTSGTVTVVTDANAIGGKYVRFDGPISSLTPTPTVNTADLLFSDDFESGSLSQWDNQSCPTGATIVSSPVRSGTHSVKFTVSDTDTNKTCPNVPTSDPRAQLVSPDLFKNGDEAYIGFSFFFPTGFPSNITDWFQIAEIYGPPFGGSPSMQLKVVGNKIAWARDSTHNYDVPWTATQAIQPGVAWEDIVLHIKFSTDPTIGYVEIWRDGVKQTFTNGSQTLFYDTLVNGINYQTGGSNDVFINQYRSASTKLGTVTLYTDDVRVGKTYASVAR